VHEVVVLVRVAAVEELLVVGRVVGGGEEEEECNLLKIDFVAGLIVAVLLSCCPYLEFHLHRVYAILNAMDVQEAHH